ncbi:Uncharacterised protein [Prevotella denticola]|uniref:Uncharacterized protein n=1 Tax=Prevotella denticola TaxID=28129 RepID=A0A379E3V0_9BACT|nr:Uncharacterised protein [Prevotella denticola]
MAGTDKNEKAGMTYGKSPKPSKDVTVDLSWA